MTLELLHVIRDYTLTRTSIPNHASHIKDMKYALIISITKLLIFMTRGESKSMYTTMMIVMLT